MFFNAKTIPFVVIYILNNWTLTKKYSYTCIFIYSYYSLLYYYKHNNTFCIKTNFLCDYVQRIVEKKITKIKE